MISVGSTIINQKYLVMITKEQVISLTNEHGKRFIVWITGLDYFGKHVEAELLSVVRTDSNKQRKEFTLIYKRKTEDKAHTAIFPDCGTKNDGCCFFGDINHFAETVANHIFGISDSRYAWRFSDEDFNRYWKTVDSIVKRYA